MCCKSLATSLKTAVVTLHARTLTAQVAAKDYNRYIKIFLKKKTHFFVKIFEDKSYETNLSSFSIDLCQVVCMRQKLKLIIFIFKYFNVLQEAQRAAKEAKKKEAGPGAASGPADLTGGDKLFTSLRFILSSLQRRIVCPDLIFMTIIKWIICTFFYQYFVHSPFFEYSVCCICKDGSSNLSQSERSRKRIW